jgi:hypothetical protein
MEVKTVFSSPAKRGRGTPKGWRGRAAAGAIALRPLRHGADAPRHLPRFTGEEKE